jgi:anti-sigma factor RsiW
MSNVLHRARFMRDHRWAPGCMSAYLDGELASRARSRLEYHIAECPECRAVLGGLRRMLGLLHGLPPAGARPAARDMTAAVRARLHEPRDD